MKNRKPTLHTRIAWEIIRLRKLLIHLGVERECAYRIATGVIERNFEKLRELYIRISTQGRRSGVDSRLAEMRTTMANRAMVDARGAM